jgi:hypothetical protein
LDQATARSSVVCCITAKAGSDISPFIVILTFFNNIQDFRQAMIETHHENASSAIPASAPTGGTLDA